jgi:hypothetical protein
MLNVFYYYYFLFYSKVLVQDEPHFVTVLALSFSETLLIIYTIDVFSAHLLCKFFSVIWYKVVILLILLAINFWYYAKNKNGLKIVKQKPKFLGNNTLSVAATMLFFLATTSFLFWMADYLMVVIENCK